MATLRPFAIATFLLIAFFPPTLPAQAAAGYGAVTAKSAGTASAGKSLGSATGSVINRAAAPLNTAPSRTHISGRTKIIDVPDAGAKREANAAPAAQVPAVFVLKSGQRIEAQRFTIAQGFVRLPQAGTGERRIPVADLDIAATLSANKARGIDLKIPTASNQVTLRF